MIDFKAVDRVSAELRRRHLPAAVSFAEICVQPGPASQYVADAALSGLVESVTRGHIPAAGFRRHLLGLTLESATVRRVGGGAGSFPAGSRADSPADGSRLSRIARGFDSLPRQAQDVLWLHLVEKEPHDNITVFAGVARQHVDESIEGARAKLRRRVIAQNRNSVDPLCHGFTRLL